VCSASAWAEAIPSKTEPCDSHAPSKETRLVNSNAGKLLVVESDDALREQIVAVLRDAGYEVSTDYQQGA